MMRTFDNVKDFVKKAGKIFEMLDALTELNKSYKQQVQALRKATLKNKQPKPQQVNQIDHKEQEQTVNNN